MALHARRLSTGVHVYARYTATNAARSNTHNNSSSSSSNVHARALIAVRAQTSSSSTQHSSSKQKQPSLQPSAAVAASAASSANGSQMPASQQKQQQVSDALQQTASAQVALLDVEGMNCGGCSAAVQRVLEGTPGVDSAAVNLVTGAAMLRVIPTSAQTADDVVAAAADAVCAKGFTARRRAAAENAVERATRLAEKDEERQKALKRAGVDLAVAWGLVGVCCAHHAGHLLHMAGFHSIAHAHNMAMFGSPWVGAALSGAALVGPGRAVLCDGYKSFVAGRPNMNSLVGLGASTSFGAGVAGLAVPSLGLPASAFLEEPVMLLAFILLGRALEERARLQAGGDLRAMAELLPRVAHLELDESSSVVDVDAGAIRTGEVVRVLPGERVPVDGTVLRGAASFDESHLTGEGRLISKAEGAVVSAGAIAWGAPVSVRASAAGAETQVASVARLVEEAQAKAAPVQRFADAAAGPFVWGVAAAAAATLAFWATAGASMFPAAVAAATGTGASFGTASALPPGALVGLRLAVDVLVCACPCALGLATPTATLVATSLAAKRGVLFRSGEALEALASCGVVVLDKTGTLTEGAPRVRSVFVAGGADGVADEAALLRLAAAAERDVRHPLATALVSAAEARGGRDGDGGFEYVYDSVTVPGCGAAATIDGRRVAIGRLDWALGEVGMGDDANGLGAVDGIPDGLTRVYICRSDDGMLGYVDLGDALKGDAVEAVRTLQEELGMQVYLCSGDSASAVNAAAAAAGIPAAYALSSQSPTDKLALVEQLKADGARVCVVGDGVNDAPALAASDCGMAVAEGVDAASEAAKVLLVGGGATRISDAVRLSRSALSRIRQNLGWAVGYNALGLPLAAGAALPTFGVALTPSAAGAMMAASSVCVVGNSLRLRGEFENWKVLPETTSAKIE